MRHHIPVLIALIAAAGLLTAGCGDSTAKTRDTSGSDSTDATGDGGGDTDTNLGDMSDADASDAGDTGDGGDTGDAGDADDTMQVTIVGTGEMCNGTTLQCGSNLVCAAGRCTPDMGPCTTDSDCQDDTYCFDPGGGAATNVCIPYGTGPRGNVNDMCTGEIVIGQMEARVQCEWAGPDPMDTYPTHANVLTTPMVADVPNDSGQAAEVVFISYNGLDGGHQASSGTDPAFYGVIRIMSGQTCEILESIHDPANPLIGSASPALADLDNDGTIEIVAQRASSNVVAFKWNPMTLQYETWWVSTGSNVVSNTTQNLRWDGPAIHDIDDDGFPEVITGSEVFDGRTGVKRNTGQIVPGTAGFYVTSNLSVAGDLDNDGNVELIGDDIYRWNRTTNQWDVAYPGGSSMWHYGYADFGTPGATAGDFDHTTLDGIAEIVGTGANAVRVWTLDGQLLMNVGGITGGGPPTMGDFDNDGLPEIALAGGVAYRVLDFDCANPMTPGCAGVFIRWSTQSQDSSSNKTGSVIFDFEGDGKAEAVYADECFTRIYEGDTGEVLYSAFRTSCTWYENPVIADPDKDQNTEFLVGSNANCDVACPTYDPIHKGQQCEFSTDCPLSGVCDSGYCRCTTNDECDPTPGDENKQYHCVAPLPGTMGTGNVCRAYHPPGVGLTGLRILKDRLDRWVSSRPMWNQHVYTVTNINDDGTVPATSNWAQNFLDPSLNNFRENIQGSAGNQDFPDITGRIDPNTVCQTTPGGGVSLRATVCNRGNRVLGADMPATFYEGDPAAGNIICVSYTQGPVPVGACLDVSCEIAASVSGIITMAVNEDGASGQTTIECNYDNNFSSVDIGICDIN